MAGNGRSGGSEQDAWLAVVAGILQALVVVLASDPELPARALYRARLWYANRDRTNHARLRFMRRQVEAGVYADDLAPAPGEVK